MNENHSDLPVKIMWSIIVLLAAFIVLAAVFPYFARPKSGNASRCLVNIKQASLAAILYQSDYDDHFPIVSHWVDALVPYSKSEGLLRCPDLPTKSTGYGHAFDSRLNQISVLTLAKPALTPMIYDSSSLQKNASDPGTSLPLIGRRKAADFGTNSIAYTDGHAKRIPATGKPSVIP